MGVAKSFLANRYIITQLIKLWKNI